MKAPMKVAKAQTKTLVNVIIDIVKKKYKKPCCEKEKHKKCTKNCSKNNRFCKKNTNDQAHTVIKKL
jgi:hypothetical protein